MSEKAQQQYLGPAGRGRPEPPSAFEMLKEQVMAPQYRESNLTWVSTLALAWLGLSKDRLEVLGATLGGERHRRVWRSGVDRGPEAATTRAWSGELGAKPSMRALVASRSRGSRGSV